MKQHALYGNAASVHRRDRTKQASMGVMAVTDEAATAKGLEDQVGHPGDKWDALKDLVQASAVKDLSDIEDEWLDLLWTLDAYRRYGIVPRGMGRPTVSPGKRLAAVYRSKGNWYAEVVALLLGNRTAQKLAPRSKVEGFSQLHQIDVAWPDRNIKPIEDPLVCLETKVTGAPPYQGTGARGAMSDWSNRRKELKFAATDLKLNRRGSTTEIDSWEEWRLEQLPFCYFLWGARMSGLDQIGRMVREVQALVNTYMDGAGLFAWRENSKGSRYEAVKITTPSDRISTVDDMLRRVATKIKKLAPTGTPPPPVRAEARPVDLQTIEDDSTSASD